MKTASRSSKLSWAVAALLVLALGAARRWA